MGVSASEVIADLHEAAKARDEYAATCKGLKANKVAVEAKRHARSIRIAAKFIAENVDIDKLIG